MVHSMDTPQGIRPNGNQAGTMTALPLIPTRAEAERLLAEAETLNPGPWAAHSRYVAQAAEQIAALHPALQAKPAYVLGLLHDIGRRVGVSDMRHVLDGYIYLNDLGYADAARICLTHSFPIQNVHAAGSQWDCSAQELQFASDSLAALEYTPYDRLIQLCDTLALPEGFCLMEKRMVDVALRHGLNEFTLLNWKARFELQKEFEQALGQSIYACLPGVIETTFQPLRF